MRLALTAGFDRSLPALLMANRLLADGHELSVVLVVSPYSIKRLHAIISSRGFSAVKKALKKLLNGVESHSSSEPNPLQILKAEQNLQTNSLKRWCKNNGIRYLSVDNINSKKAVSAVEDSSSHMLVYGGGGLLQATLIDSVNGNVINPHAGPLPEIRGMNAIEWATILDLRQSVTLHFIDIGIDTGRLIGETPLTVECCDNIDTLRSNAVATGVVALCDALESINDPTEISTYENRGHAAGRQCYQLSQAMTELLAVKLNRSKQ